MLQMTDFLYFSYMYVAYMLQMRDRWSDKLKGQYHEIFPPSNFFAKLTHQVSWLSCWSIFKYDIWLKSSNFDSALSVIPWSPKFSLTVKLDCFSSSMLRLCGVNDIVEFDSAVSMTPLSLTQRCQWLNRSSVSLMLRRIISNKKISNRWEISSKFWTSSYKWFTSMHIGSNWVRIIKSVEHFVKLSF